MRVIIPVNCPHIYTTAAIVGKIVNPLIYVGCFTSSKLGNFSRKKKIINDVIHVLLINTMQCLHFAMAANGGHVTLKWLAAFFFEHHFSTFMWSSDTSENHLRL